MDSSAHSLASLLGIGPSDLSEANALERLRTTSPSAYLAMLQWQQLRQAVASETTTMGKRQVIAQRLREGYNLPEEMTPERIYNRLARTTKKALEETIDLFREYLPRSLRKRVNPQCHKNTDPIHLVETGLPAQNGQMSFTSDQRAFEARRNLVMGLLWFDFFAQRWSGRDPVNDPGELTRYLVETKVLSRPIRRVLLSLHDPENDLHCAGVNEFDEPKSRKGLVTRKNHIFLATLNVANDRITIIYSVRVKRPISLVRRMLVDDEWDPSRVRDLRAFRFCYFSKDDLLNSYSVVAENLLPGATGRVKDRFTDEKRNPNPHSASDFRGIKHLARIGGRVYEVDHLLARTWLDIQHCYGPINHGLYHARQMWEKNPPGLFRCVLPKEIYGIDWDSQKVQKQIKNHILSSLPK